MLDILLDTVIDSIKLLPFLFITYLLMEYLEHKTSSKTKEKIKKSGKYGPIIGSLLGIVPQCGFSVSATNLYAARVITLGTLISVYLTTSDEMLPVLISEAIPIQTIFLILGIKLFIGMISGFIIDLIIRKDKKVENEQIESICEHEHCHCDEGILKSSIKHTISIFIFILLFNLLLNIVIGLIGEEILKKSILNMPFIGTIIAGLIGLIPNCASSVILTELYIEKIISISTMIAGLLVNAGVGTVVLFKINKNLKENIKIIGIIYVIGIISGIILNLIGI